MSGGSGRVMRRPVRNPRSMSDGWRMIFSGVDWRMVHMRPELKAPLPW